MASKQEKEVLIELLWGNWSIGLSGLYGVAAGLVSRAAVGELAVSQWWCLQSKLAGLLQW